MTDRIGWEFDGQKPCLRSVPSKPARFQFFCRTYDYLPTIKTPEVAIGIILTVLIHSVPVAIYVQGGCGNELAAEVAEVGEPLPVTPAVLMRWGEVLPEDHQLPRNSNPALEVRPEDVVILENDQV